MKEPDTNKVTNLNHYHRERGFSLVEVLVAVFIFAIVTTTIFGSFNMVAGKSGDIEKMTNRYEMGKNCLDRIATDIRSLHIPLPPLYSPPDFNQDPDQYRFLGEIKPVGNLEAPMLRFAAHAHLPFEGNTKTGTARIVYYVQEISTGQYVLRRSDSLFPNDMFEESQIDPVVCENLTALSFTYYDTDGDEFEDWDSDSRDHGYASPSAIKISIKIGEENDEIALETMIFIPVTREKETR